MSLHYKPVWVGRWDLSPRSKMVLDKPILGKTLMSRGWNWWLVEVSHLILTVQSMAYIYVSYGFRTNQRRPVYKQLSASSIQLSAATIYKGS
jgi:hypothetical protein